jgi:hypothetical protein
VFAADPADVTFWQSVQNSKNPAEYNAYLHAFPHGQFVELAHARLNELSHPVAQINPIPLPATKPGPVFAAASAPAGLGPVVGKGTITVKPESPQVGDKIELTLERFPHLTTMDLIVIVPSGSPDSTGANSGATTWAYATLCQNTAACSLGPFAPGTYEVRWLTQLYNNQQKYQVGARTQFTVTD